jgi:hypothetical protein
LATLIPPLREGDLSTEARYISDLQHAIEKHPAVPLQQADRAKIADSVKGKEWRHVHQLTRAKYLTALDG